jgi:hypothetical protein
VRVTRNIGAVARPVRGATVRLRGRRARTNRKGAAVFRFARGVRGPIGVRASKRGYDPAGTRIAAAE